jgi:hypothetical protein
VLYLTDCSVVCGLNGENFFASGQTGRDDEVRGPAHSTLTKRAPKELPFDYVFFDWKGTLAKKSGLNSHERTDLRCTARVCVRVRAWT